jgi:hypothetical protein
LPPIVQGIELSESRVWWVLRPVRLPSTYMVTDVAVRTQRTVCQAPLLMVTEPDPAVAMPPEVREIQVSRPRAAGA